jgi:hypothetical protein
MPFGGSSVAFTLFCTIVTGNLSEGKVVNQILNPLPSSSLMLSTIPSRIGMKEGARWQFWRTTQVPSAYAAAM